MLARMLLYNSWKMNKKLIQISSGNRGKRASWTLIQNQDFLMQAFLSKEKKSLGVIG